MSECWNIWCSLENLSGEYTASKDGEILSEMMSCALENAVSGASMILTTEASVSDIPKKDDNPGMPQMPMGGGMPGMGM